MLETTALLGGKGVDENKNEPKEPFRCRHRWALVSKAAIREKARSVGTLFIQNCRRCGTFRASSLTWICPSGKIVASCHIQYFNSGAGIQTIEFDIDKGEQLKREG